MTGRIGIGHTRWATHGVPSERNAHPIATARVAVVHNGIIENFQALKSSLEGAGYRFETQTDTEAVAMLVTRHLDAGLSPREAVAKSLQRLEGAFALVMLFAGEPDLLICARRGSPLAVGFGDGEMYVGSDALALAPLTRRIVYLEEGDWAEVTGKRATIRNADDVVVERPIRETALSGALIGKGNHRHFMKKEIFEQPTVIGDTLLSHFNPATRSVHLPHLPFDLAAVSRVTIIACGTSYHAGLVAKYWLEQHRAGVVRGRYRVGVPLPRRRHAGGRAGACSSRNRARPPTRWRRCAMPRRRAQRIVAVVNQPESSIAREADAVLATHAGPEIGVASTKAFTTQLVVLACLTIALARASGRIDAAREAALSTALTEVPARASEVLNHDERILSIAQDFAETRDVLYLGRGTSYPLALEGRAEAQGNLLHPCRGLCRRRDEAWADRAHRRPRADRRAGAVGRALREDAVERAGGAGARRPRGHDLRPRRARAARRPVDVVDRGAALRTVSWRPCSTPSRCSFWPTISPSSRAPTSISRAISRKA